jgi:hypothetical protein
MLFNAFFLFVVTEITKNEDLAYKGIQTDLKAVRSYIDEVSKEIRININKFIQNLAIPLNRDPLFILGQIQSEDSDYFQEIETIVTQPVLPVELYLEIERNRKVIPSFFLLSSYLGVS